MKNLILTMAFLFAGLIRMSADSIDTCTANATWNNQSYSVTAPNCEAALAGLKAALCEDGWEDPRGGC